MSFGRILNFPNSLAFRLTVWYGVIFTVSSCVAFLLFYTLIDSLLRERTDQDLLSQAQRFSIVLARDGIGALANAVVIEAQAAGEKKVFFRLLSAGGETFSSSNMSYWTDIGVDGGEIETLMREKEPILRTIAIPQRSDRVRVLYALLSPRVIAQSGQTMEHQARLLEAFRRIFIATMSCVILLAAAVGWFMSRRAVSGVEAVTRTASKIAAGALHERVPAQPGGNEIDQLALTFNQMLDRIQTLVSEIKQMSENIAHDLRSPIARMRGLAEITLTNAKSAAEFETMAASTMEECDRLLDMINTMLLISKTEAGVEKPADEPVELAALVEKACALFQPLADENSLQLTCRTPGECRISGDARMLQRMLANILDNAVKYTPAGGRIEVSLDDGPQNVSIQVRDDGIGIAAADLGRIFERFYRCDRSRSEPGTGLGLSLARAIARAHGGEITVVSEIQRGSTFTIRLPKRMPNETPAAALNNKT